MSSLKYNIGDIVWFMPSIINSSELFYEDGNKVFACYRFINHPICGKIKSIYVETYIKGSYGSKPYFTSGCRYYKKEEVEYGEDDRVLYELDVYLSPSDRSFKTFKAWAGRNKIVTSFELSKELNHLWDKIYKDEAFIHGVISVDINDVAITPEQAEHNFLMHYLTNKNAKMFSNIITPPRLTTYTPYVLSFENFFTKGCAKI